MAKYKYRISETAKKDLIRIHHYGVERFGVSQADRYFNTFFKYFDIITRQPMSFEAVDFIRPGYRRCVCGSETIYYRVNHDLGTIDIMGILGRQDFR